MSPSLRPPIDFEPLSSALRDGGPPYLSADWRDWVRARRRRAQYVNPAALAIGGRLGVSPDTADALLCGWNSEGAIAEFVEPTGVFAALLQAVQEYTAIWLAEHGVTSAWLWRGEAIPGPRRIERQMVTLPMRAHATPLLVLAVSIAEIRMRQRGVPTGRLLLFQVPAGRIVSTSMTGLGQPDTVEVIVDGGDVEALVWSVGPRDRQRAWDPSFGRRLLSEARWAREKGTAA